MLSFGERLVAEKQQLQDRIEKLDTFLKTQICDDLPFEEKQMLEMQLAAMYMYLFVLEDVLTFEVSDAFNH